MVARVWGSLLGFALLVGMLVDAEAVNVRRYSRRDGTSVRAHQRSSLSKGASRSVPASRKTSSSRPHRSR